MFDKNSAYAFTYLTNHKEKRGEYEIVNHILTFTCRYNHQYIVNVEEYTHAVFVVKFHLKSHSLSKNKYNLTTGFNDMGRVVATCLTIMVWFLRDKNPKASFGFIGAHSINEVGTSKRFKIYTLLMANIFTPMKFVHYEFQKENAYLLLNREQFNNSTELENGLSKITQMFHDLYEI